ncbi:MAG: tetratricopeptide repeat protein [Acidobacteriota bacterium]|nr:tetratricopeptide repeat protein [Acidobacteriota bacterium]
MLSSWRITLLFVCFALSAVGVFSQDLGSSNKLFRASEPKSKSNPAPTKKTAPKKAAPKKPVTAAVKTKTPTKPKPTAKIPTTVPKSNIKSSTAAQKNKPSTNTPAKTAKNTKLPMVVNQPVKTPPQNKQNNDVVTRVGQPAGGSSEFDDLFEQGIADGNAARDARDYMKAEGAYLRAQSLKTKDSRAVYGLGNLYSDQQRWEEAERAYRTAIELEPDSTDAHIALSYVLTQPIVGTNLSDRYSEAERLARRAIELDKTNPLAYDQLGVALELNGAIGDETQRAYRQAIKLDAGFALAYAHLGRLLRRTGETNESGEAYRNSIRLATDVPTMILVADVMQSQQRFLESEQLLRRALRDDPKHPTALFLLGRALTTRNEFDEAETVLKKSAEVSPNGFVAYMLLGSMYSRQNKFGKAEDSLTKALKVVSLNEKKRLAQEFEAVGDGFLRAGKSKDAARVYRQAVNLDAEKETLAAKLAQALNS